MDTVTHTLLGLTLYNSVEKQDYSKEKKRALLFTTIVGSQIPDIDVLSQLWDTSGQYQMWHRGITHSIFMIPIWAIILAFFCFVFWRIKDKQIFLIGALAVFVHSTFDLFNAWGTGYFEPFSAARITFGTVPIIDFVIWSILLGSFIWSKKSNFPSYHIYRIAWALILLHVALQTSQGYIIYQQNDQLYEQQALSARFLPWNYTLVGKNDNKVEIIKVNLWSEQTVQHVLESSDEANLDYLFEQKPEAKTLYEWSPFVVVIDDEQMLGIYDPRFYRNGQSFLFESIQKE